MTRDDDDDGSDPEEKEDALVVVVPDVIGAAYAHVRPVVREFRRTLQNYLALGSETTTTVRLGARALTLERACFFGALRMLEDYTAWKTRRVDLCHEYTHSTDVVTTSTFISSASSSSSSAIDVKHVRATVLRERGLSMSGGHERDVAVDIVATRVEPVAAATLSSVVLPDRVRFFKQLRFYLDDKWCFVFTESWTGATHEEAERKQSRGESAFDIDVEYLFSAGAAASTSSYLTVSLLLKVGSVLGNGGGVMPAVRPRGQETNL